MLPGQIAEPAIPEDDPFRNGKLDREPTADFLTDLLCSAEGPYVMSLNAPWGTGKTTFVKMWKQKLINDGYSALYFNAWENDFADDPLIAFIDAIDVLVDEQSGGSKTEALKNACGEILKRVAPLGIRVLTWWALSGDGFDDGFGELLADQKDDIANAVIEGGGDLVKAHQQKKGAIETFRKELKTFVDELQGDEDEAHGHAPLFFFVDELDRCRPDFAVELLERIKHLFNVPGIIFILVTNLDQLRHSVKAMYGQGMNAKGYLRRFVDLDYTLPDPEPGVFAEFLFEKHGLENFRVKTRSSNHQANDKERESILSLVAWSCETLGLKLREQKQYFIRLALVHHVLDKREPIPIAARAFLAFLVALRKKRKTLYDDLQQDKAKHEEINELVNSLAVWKNTYGNVSPAILQAALDVSYCADDEQYYSYRKRTSKKRDAIHSRMEESPLSIPRLGTNMTSVKRNSFSLYFKHIEELSAYDIHFEQKLIDLIELAAPAEQSQQ